MDDQFLINGDCRNVAQTALRTWTLQLGRWHACRCVPGRSWTRGFLSPNGHVQF
jgi:hypothetical protein